METIQAQVQRAWRRLLLQQFLTWLCSTLALGLGLAACGLAVPRLWPMVVPRPVWDAAWLVGAALGGLVVALVATALRRRSRLQAALEIDRRFALKERVSSALALAPPERDTPMGQALVADASKRVAQVDVAEAVPVTVPRRKAAMALGTLLLAGALTQVPLRHERSQASEQADAKRPAETVQPQVVVAAKKLQEQLRETQTNAEALSLEDAELLRQVDRELDKLLKQRDLDRKDALLKINDLAQQVEARRQQLASAEQVRQQLSRLGDLSSGPAEQLAEALKSGDLSKTQQALEKLAQTLSEGKLSAQQREQLAQQLEQLQEQIRQALAEQEEGRQQLAQQIEKKIAEGKLGEAAQLQQQLDQLQSQASQQALERLAEKLARAGQALKQGEGAQDGSSSSRGQTGPSADARAGTPGDQAAAAQLSELAESLKGIDRDLEALRRTQGVLDRLAEAKMAMNCAQCQGQGCAQCQGGAASTSTSDLLRQTDGAEGRGRGAGRRDEQRSDGSFYDSRVAADPKAGESVRIGDAGGPNKAGRSLEAVKAELHSALAQPPDALDDVALPRDHRDNARQFFEKLRKGQ
jgi:hypothetical protein